MKFIFHDNNDLDYLNHGHLGKILFCIETENILKADKIFENKFGFKPEKR